MRMTLDDFALRACMAARLTTLPEGDLHDPLARMAAYQGIGASEDRLRLFDEHAAHVETLRRKHAVIYQAVAALSV